METWFRRIFLSALAMISLGSPAAQAQQSIYEPEVERREFNEADIDSENFEIGAFVGVVSIEDFEQDTVVGARLAYHISENLFVEASAGFATAGQTSFEVLSGGAPFLTDEERDYTYYDLSVGYNINGEVFVTDSLVLNSDFYLLVGGGSTEFGGDDRFTISVGGGYRLLLTDYFALRLDVRDHIFNSDLIGEEKATHNLAYSVSATFFF
ncbi:outer membrane beta-barrel domain-containing protein [Aestuariibacter salexigens]|uniref:outer membrane beta-barrel domain-containing protein n=1 Tax=Aestuariibacter salexigens TaxID=226010 RepID=UPI00042681B8|nr:outer membrane beta-barrel domain-containing protein [Aestuariibacter salexigens]